MCEVCTLVKLQINGCGCCFRFHPQAFIDNIHGLPLSPCRTDREAGGRLASCRMKELHCQNEG